MMKSLQEKLSKAPHKLFLTDGVGAMVSAFLYSVILTYFSSHLGIPNRVFYLLAGLASLYALFSFISYVTKVVDWSRNLKIIATANLCHCFLTIFIGFYYSETITFWAVAYFAGEIIIVGLLSWVELKVASV